MFGPQSVFRGVCSRFLPRAQNDTLDTDRTVRIGRWGDVRVESGWPTDHLLADEGGYMVAAMRPGATALELGVSATFSATAAAVVLANSDILGGKRIYPRFLKFGSNGGFLSATDWRYAVVLDSKDRTPTTISSGADGIGPGTPATATAYRPPTACVNGDINNPLIVGLPYFPLGTSAGTPPTIPSPGQFARTIVGNAHLKNSQPQASDTGVIQFGWGDAGGTFSALQSLLCRQVDFAPPVVIGPGQFMVVHMWSTSNSGVGASFSDLVMAWIEK